MLSIYYTCERNFGKGEYVKTEHTKFIGTFFLPFEENETLTKAEVKLLESRLKDSIKQQNKKDKNLKTTFRYLSSVYSWKYQKVIFEE